jgi:hypothetical protein
MGSDSSRTSSNLGSRRGAAAGSLLRPAGAQSISSPWRCWEVVIKQVFYFTLSFICFLLVMSLFEVDDAEIVASSSRPPPLSPIPRRPIHHSQTKPKEPPKSLTETASMTATRKTAVSSTNQKKSTTNTTTTTTTIGYVVTVTDCGEDGEFPFPITEGAAVLYYSIQRAHAAAAAAQTDDDAISYDFKVYAVYHPAAAACAQTLAPLNYTLIQRDTPVAVPDIQGDYLRDHIHANGCCGERELIKLEAWRLTQHALVVLLDLDCLILQPLDALFDFMLHGQIPTSPSDELQWPELYNASTVSASSSSHQISLLYTLDYNMVGPHRKIKPIQGGFVVLRPSETTYQNLVDIVRVGDYRENGGWGGKTMKFYGGMTIQGLLPYYWLAVNEHNAQEQSVELNRCIYNNMASSHRKGWAEGEVNGTCYIHSPNNDCEDCRLRPIEQVKTTHFTVCQKPWLCQRHVGPSTNDERTHLLCRKLHHEWFRIRSEMEQSWGRLGHGSGNFSDAKHFYGYCDKRGQQGYHLIQKPYGLPVNEADPAQVQTLRAAAPSIAGDNAASATRR